MLNNEIKGEYFTTLLRYEIANCAHHKMPFRQTIFGMFELREIFVGILLRNSCLSLSIKQFPKQQKSFPIQSTTQATNESFSVINRLHIHLTVCQLHNFKVSFFAAIPEEGASSSRILYHVQCFFLFDLRALEIHFSPFLRLHSMLRDFTMLFLLFLRYFVWGAFVGEIMLNFITFTDIC